MSPNDLPEELHKLIVASYECVPEDGAHRLVMVMVNGDRHYKAGGTEAEMLDLAAEGNKLLTDCTESGNVICVSNPAEIDMQKLKISLVTDHEKVVTGLDDTEVKHVRTPGGKDINVVLITDAVRGAEVAAVHAATHVRVPHVHVGSLGQPMMGEKLALATMSMLAGGPAGLPSLLHDGMLRRKVIEPLPNALPEERRQVIESETMRFAREKRERREARRLADKERTKKQRESHRVTADS